MTVRDLIQELIKHDMDMTVATIVEGQAINIDEIKIERQDGWKDKVVLF